MKAVSVCLICSNHSAYVLSIYATFTCIYTWLKHLVITLSFNGIYIGIGAVIVYHLRVV